MLGFLARFLILLFVLFPKNNNNLAFRTRVHIPLPFLQGRFDDTKSFGEQKKKY